MKIILLAIIILCPLSACRERKAVEDAARQDESGDSADQTPAVDPDAAASPQPKEETLEPVPSVESPKDPVPPPVVPLVKPSEKYNEFCSFAKNLETTENTIRLSAENFGFRAGGGLVETLQCLVTLDATIPKGKRLLPVILPQSYYTGLGMLTSGQSLQVDLVILTLAGDTIEASLEYQALALGPIANDTEFVRSMQLMRRIAPVCQTADLVKRTLAVFIVLTVNKGASATIPPVMTREIPRIDYVLESCSNPSTLRAAARKYPGRMLR